MTNETKARNRVAASNTLSKYSSIIFYDWPNWDEHMEWIANTDELEIIEWAQCEGDD